jgi:hypothetical protein
MYMYYHWPTGRCKIPQGTHVTGIGKCTYMYHVHIQVGFFRKDILKGFKVK